jgi:multidrug efflux system membrane fusion protein
MAFAVETSDVEAASVGFTTTAVGTLEAFERVMVTARVAGVIDDVRFREGDVVKQGQVLAAIETERYALAVRAARAALERAQANLADAEAGLNRREAADKASPGLVRGEEVETYRARVSTARADVASATVQVDQAVLNQRDAAVRAPMDGVIQTRDARTGQYAQPGALIATLLRRDPLLLRFSLPEADAASLKAGDEVRFTLSGLSADHAARVTHVAASADATTRMVPVVAEVPDPEGRLRAGAFAEIVVPLGAARTAPVVPQSAIRPSEKGFLAFVAEGDKARERIVVLGQRTPDGRVEIREGLRVGEKLVVRGAEALREGASIRLGGGAAPGPRSGGSGGPPGEPGAAGSAPASTAGSRP